MIQNKIDTIDVVPILGELAGIRKNIAWTVSTQGKQTGLQYKDEEDPWTSAVGRSRGEELEFNKLNPFFKDTIFETLINKYNLKRTRLMWVNARSCYSFHCDPSPRIHIPLITNPECYFLFDPGVMFHLGLNSIWWVDTTQKHTFLNCSNKPRLHLVGIVEK
jgi:hypothetical protein